MDQDALPQDPPQDPPAPPAQAAIPVSDLSGALVDAFQKITASQQRQPQAVQDPFDALSPADREAIATQSISDPVGAARRVYELGAKATEQRLIQQALPLIQTSANTIVELFKTRKQRSDPYFAKIEPLFDKLMVGVDITPLVNMNEATRNNELDMRWKNARSDVLEAEMKRQKPDPTLTAIGSGSGPAATDLSDDPWMSNMAKQYGFTPEQMKELESLNG